MTWTRPMPFGDRSRNGSAVFRIRLVLIFANTSTSASPGWLFPKHWHGVIQFLGKLAFNKSKGRICTIRYHRLGGQVQYFYHHSVSLFSVGKAGVEDVFEFFTESGLASGILTTAMLHRD